MFIRLLHVGWTEGPLAMLPSAIMQLCNSKFFSLSSWPLILPFCCLLKFFSFNFSTATHILIGTLCLRKDSGIGASTQHKQSSCGFWLCFVCLLWLSVVVVVSVYAVSGSKLFLTLPYSLNFLWRWPWAPSLHLIASCLEQGLWLLLGNSSKLILGPIAGLDLQVIICSF